MTNNKSAPPYKADESLNSYSGLYDMYAGDRNRTHSYVGARGNPRSHSRASPQMGRHPGRPLNLGENSGSNSYYNFAQRRSTLGHPGRSTDHSTDAYGSHSSIRRNNYSVRSIPRAPSFGRRPGNTDSFASSRRSPQMHAAETSSRMLSPLAHPSALSEKYTSAPYEAGFGQLVVDDADDELVEMIHAQRVKRIVKYSLYALIAAVLLLGCSLTAYFLLPRSPAVALHSVNSPDRSGKFKLLGSKMQFQIELTYRVHNDNFFDLIVDDISSAVFWPETKFALGGGRLSNINVPARGVVEITMPITIRYDVKHGPPAILLGLVDSCGLHDPGAGEMTLDAEVQSDFHTKMKKGAMQSGRQSVSVKCPARRLGTLQVGDGSSGNLGDIVRTLSI
ncbi:hypothetical protein LPJ66_006173 [Kickxella alabastrina]|uniref:Uncharacterized protein n=1 Tax=Kickxella alabastrina TaxID=61397 RepID=A0ACC1ID15_9FUNG|nr:hypothetical protein LPJ66_006173 [Kickxella alabastrina]